MQNLHGLLYSTNTDYQLDVLDTFNKRIQEINLFFELIDKFESVNSVQFITPDNTIGLIVASDLVISSSVEITVRNILAKLKTEVPDVNLVNIFKSNSILLLYNLIESTISNTNKVILKTISDAAMLYSQAIPEVRQFWVEYKSKFDNKECLKTAINILDNISTITIDINKEQKSNQKEFEGRLDARGTDKLLGRYGIEKTAVKMEHQNPERAAVQNIVDLRNVLAHGESSFVEVGRNKLKYNLSPLYDKTMDVLFLKSSCLLFLEIVLGNVEDYILNKKYKI